VGVRGLATHKKFLLHPHGRTTGSFLPPSICFSNKNVLLWIFDFISWAYSRKLSLENLIPESTILIISFLQKTPSISKEKQIDWTAKEGACNW